MRISQNEVRHILLAEVVLHKSNELRTLFMISKDGQTQYLLLYKCVTIAIYTYMYIHVYVKLLHTYFRTLVFVIK